MDPAEYMVSLLGKTGMGPDDVFFDCREPVHDVLLVPVPALYNSNIVARRKALKHKGWRCGRGREKKKTGGTCSRVRQE
jgi:hypothetical protein